MTKDTQDIPSVVLPPSINIHGSDEGPLESFSPKDNRSNMIPSTSGSSLTPNFYSQATNSESTENLSTFSPGTNPIPRIKKNRSIADLRASTLFLNPDGDAEKRLSILNPSSSRPASALYTNPKRVSRISNTLTNESPMLAVYRESALKTKDPSIQMEFAKFIFEQIESLQDPDIDSDIPTDPQSIEKLTEEGVFWINKLNKANHPEAVYLVGTWYEHGKYGYSPSNSRAFSQYQSANKSGHPGAMYKMGEHYEHRNDYTRAVAFYKKACALGSPAANYRIGIAYLYGDMKLPKSQQSAHLFLRRASQAATKEFPQGAYIWGLILLGIFEVDLGLRDEIEARESLEKAADLKYVPAIFKCGYCYEYGEHGFPVDPAKSIYYYKSAAHRGHPEAQMALSGWYLTGAPGVLEPRDQEAIKWCSLAANQNLPKAEYAMGYYHEVGVGVEINMDEAMKWYHRAARNGSVEAKKRLEKDAPQVRRSEYGSVKIKKHTKGKDKKGDCVIC
jgi:TPR repeat protein